MKPKDFDFFEDATEIQKEDITSPEKHQQVINVLSINVLLITYYHGISKNNKAYKNEIKIKCQTKSCI